MNVEEKQCGDPIPLHCDLCGGPVVMRFYSFLGEDEVVLTYRFDPHICPSPTPSRSPEPVGHFADTRLAA